MLIFFFIDLLVKLLCAAALRDGLPHFFKTMKQATDKTARTRFQTWLHQADWITYPDIKKATKESCIAEQKRRERMATTEHQAPETKKCFTCGRELPAADFGVHKQSKDGLNSSCKECTRAKQKGYREADKAARARAKKKADAAKKATEDAKKKIERMPEAIDPTPIKPKLREKEGWPRWVTGATVETRPAGGAILSSDTLPPPECKVEPFESAEMKSATLVEIPSRGWFRAFTDDDLYSELVARGWRGTLTKRLEAE